MTGKLSITRSTILFSKIKNGWGIKEFRRERGSPISEGNKRRRSGAYEKRNELNVDYKIVHYAKQTVAIVFNEYKYIGGAHGQTVKKRLTMILVSKLFFQLMIFSMRMLTIYISFR